MEKKLNDFILSIKANVRPFAYLSSVQRTFILSYDESIDELDDEDFRPYIIAALHAKGAINMKSYVASTIVFQAAMEVNNAYGTITNWKEFLTETFDSEFHFTLGMLAIYTNENPILVFDSKESIENQFDEKQTMVMNKFRTL